MKSLTLRGQRRKDALLAWLTDNPGMYTPAEMVEKGFVYPDDLRDIIDHRYNATRLALNELADEGHIVRKRKTVTVNQPYTPLHGVGVAKPLIPTKEMKVFCWGVKTDEAVQRAD